MSDYPPDYAIAGYTTCVETIGAVTMQRLTQWCEHHGGWRAWWRLLHRVAADQSQQEALSTRGRSRKPLEWPAFFTPVQRAAIAAQHTTLSASFARFMDTCQRHHIHIFLKGQPEYAAAFSRLLGYGDGPVVLFAWGNVERLAVVAQMPCVAIVGTRHPTPYGKHITQHLAHALAQQGVTIISGFMYGVDVAAQEAVIAEGGTSLAILGYGYGQCYPRSFQEKLEQFMAHGGICLSEFPPGTPPAQGTFVARNRIIAALSDVIVVTEATMDSGSRHTVQFGLQYGKEIGAVPGEVENIYAEGTNQLIVEGAAVIRHAQDVMELLPANATLEREEKLMLQSSVHAVSSC